jgi:hypothetical protein
MERLEVPMRGSLQVFFGSLSPVVLIPVINQQIEVEHFFLKCYEVHGLSTIEQRFGQAKTPCADKR